MYNISDTHPSGIMKFCPACGTGRLSFSIGKLFTCTVCGFTLYLNPAPAVAAIIETPGGGIVLTRRKHDPRSGYLDLPGGFVDIMESAEDALRREIKEELGLDIRSMAFIGTFPNEYVYNGMSYFTCDLGFMCACDDLSGMKPADDVSEAIVIRPDDIDFSKICFPSIEGLLRLYINLKAGRQANPLFF